MEEKERRRKLRAFIKVRIIIEARFYLLQKQHRFDVTILAVVEITCSGKQTHQAPTTNAQ